MIRNLQVKELKLDKINFYFLFFLNLFRNTNYY